MVDVSVRQGGEALQVADGQQLDIAIVVPAAVVSPAAETGLWSYDEQSAQWVEEGTMTFDSTTRTYRAQIGHLSIWNADNPVERTCVCGETVDSSGTPLAGVIMSGEGLEYLGVTADLSGADGRFCLVVRRSSTIRVGPYPFALGGAVREVVSGAVDTEVPPLDDGAACTDIGQWVIDEAVYFPPGGAGGCSLVNNPLAGTCAAGMGEFGACWDASGECSYSTGGTTGDVTIEYASGASYVGQVSESDGSLTGTYLASDGTVCASMLTTLGSNTITFTLADGSSVDIVSNPDDGSTTYICEDDTAVTLSAADSAALRACYDTGSSQQQCTLQGGGMGAACQDDSQCNEPLICCTIQTMQLCYDQPTCDQINP
jgi:hypothetical protein